MRKQGIDGTGMLNLYDRVTGIFNEIFDSRLLTVAIFALIGYCSLFTQRKFPMRWMIFVLFGMILLAFVTLTARTPGQKTRVRFHKGMAGLWFALHGMMVVSGLFYQDWLPESVSLLICYPIVFSVFASRDDNSTFRSILRGAVFAVLPFLAWSSVSVPLSFAYPGYKGVFYDANCLSMCCIVMATAALLLFGSLPVTYYIFDYATTIYSDALYSGIQALNEFLPTVLVTFYVLFLPAFHLQSQRRTDAEMQRSMLEAELEQSQSEMDSLHRLETQTAVYQHDMRHHLNAIDGFLAAGKPQQAEEYIRKVRSDIERITPKRYCDNELVNLLCSSFAGKAQRMGVRLEVDAKLPRELSVSDTELCAVLSNALENALRAVSDQPEADRWVTLYCGVRLGKLLVEIQNPCAEGLVMRDGLPVSERAGHGYGCRSIQTIAERRGGLCEFRARGGIFSMQFMLPVKAAAKTQD
mgnify:CR=1 FL=1